MNYIFLIFALIISYPHISPTNYGKYVYVCVVYLRITIRYHLLLTLNPDLQFFFKGFFFFEYLVPVLEFTMSHTTSRTTYVACTTSGMPDVGETTATPPHSIITIMHYSNMYLLQNTTTGYSRRLGSSAKLTPHDL